MQNSCLKTSAWWSRGSHCVENGYLSLRFPNMAKVNIHEHWTRVTRFNPLWVSALIYTVLWDVTIIKNGERGRATGKWKMGTSPNFGPSPLPSPLSSFISNCLFGSLARSLLSVPCFSIPVLCRHYTTTAWNCQFLRLSRIWTHDSDFLF